MDDEEVLEAARAIRPHLRSLIGDQADETDSEIARLLDQAEAGEAVKLQVLQVLSRSEETRAWASQFLRIPPGERAYEGLPGRSGPLRVPRYACRFGDGEPWYRFSVADEVPVCPEHRIAYDRVT